jgi:L-amino acid N-acyltransferase YncA
VSTRIIRFAEAADARGIADVYAPIVAGTAISFEDDPPTEQEMAARIAGALRHAPWLVCADASGVAGYVYASRHRDRAAYRWSVDVSVYVRAADRRGGVGRALYTSLFALLRLQGFRAAHAGITLPNPASVAIHESFGFRRIGVYPAVGFKLGRWHDVGWWQLELGDRTVAPEPPLSVEALRRADGFDAALASGLRLLAS